MARLVPLLFGVRAKTASRGSGTFGRWGVLVGIVMCVAGCTAAPLGESLMLDDEFALPRLEPNRCAGAQRSEVVAIEEMTGMVQWAQEVPWTSNANAVLVDDRVIVSSAWQTEWEGSAQALARDDGRPLWQIGLGEPSHQARPNVVAGGAVIIPRIDQVVAVRPGEGAVVWAHDLDSHMAVAATEAHLYIKDDSLSAVDPSSGDLAWSRPTGGDASYAPLPLSDRVIVADYAGAVSAISPDGEDELWTWSGVDEELFGVVGASEDHVVVVVGQAEDLTGRVTVLDSATGELRWQGPYMVQPEVVATDDLIVVTALDRRRQLAAFGTATGEQVWSGELAQTPLWAAVTTPTGTIVLRGDWRGGPDGGTVTLVNGDGAVHWEVTLDYHPDGAAVLDGGQLLVWGRVGSDGPSAIALLDAGSGATTWRTSLDRPLQTPPLQVGGALIALASDYAVTCD